LGIAPGLTSHRKTTSTKTLIGFPLVPGDQ
jgi:hypothetical protein